MVHKLRKKLRGDLIYFLNVDINHSHGRIKECDDPAVPVVRDGTGDVVLVFRDKAGVNGATSVDTIDKPVETLLKHPNKTLRDMGWTYYAFVFAYEDDEDNEVEGINLNPDCVNDLIAVSPCDYSKILDIFIDEVEVDEDDDEYDEDEEHMMNQLWGAVVAVHNEKRFIDDDLVKSIIAFM
jgi:hypothetical protein